MNIQVFIISWKGMHARAEAIERAVMEAGFATHMVLSDPDPAFAHQAMGAATQLADTSYWAEKFRCCVLACRAQRMLVIHADTECGDWGALITRCLEVMQARPDIGVWAPRIENAHFTAGNASLRGWREDGLVPVANTDGIVFCLAAPEVERMREVDYSRNRLGWGIAWVFCSSAYASGRMAVIDGAIEVKHLPGRGYDSGEALQQALRFLVRELRPRERIQFELLSRQTGRIF
jgi:hypothetical protein